MSHIALAGHFIHDMSVEADDERLLEMYVAQRSGEAFSQIVRRHIQLVYASALRQVGEAQMAEDITQTVFALLARKAGSVRRHSLAAWLLAVTRHAAANERRAALRRRRRERQSAKPHAVAPPPADEDDVTALLDDALARLSELDRQAVVLRYMQGRDARSIAAALGVSEQAARKRLTRAVERLRRFFRSRGLVIAPATLGGALTAKVDVPAGLAQKVIASALAPSPARLSAVRHIERAMWRTPSRAAAGALAAAILIVGGTIAVPATLRAHSALVSQTIAAPARPHRPNLKLTLAWNHQTCWVPVPISFPDEVQRFDEYRSWESTREPRMFTWMTRDGRRYVAQVVASGSEGRRTALVPWVKLFRRDGTLQVEAINDERGDLRQWRVYAANGKTKQVIVTNCSEGSPAVPYIQSVQFFDPDGTSREYEANRNGTVYREWLLDNHGRRVRLLNGGSRYDDATANLPGGPS